MTNTIPNPMDSQREELAVTRIARDMALNELEEIAAALYVRAGITVTTDVADAVNELLDSWEELYGREAQAWHDEVEADGLRLLRDRLKVHKTPLNLPDKFRKRFGDDNGE